MSKSYSARLLNHTEPVMVNGMTKTAFYSEHSIDISVGDKLFVLNGNFDSDSFPYLYGRNSKFVDGYRVLMVDKCKITLDIDWDFATNVYEELDISEFIKVWNVRTAHELNYYASIMVDLYEIKINRYAYRQSNDIVFIDESFVNDSLPRIEFKQYDQDNILVDLPNPEGHFFGFLNGVWVEDDYRHKYNEYKDVTYDGGLNIDFLPPYDITNNRKIYIIGEDIVLDPETIYRQRSVYKYDTKDGKYVIDICYKKALISKLNFRGGVFSGNYNGGVFGTYLSPNKWDSDGIWNGGIFVNSNWVSGELRSNVSESEVFVSYISDGVVMQVSDMTSNNSFGYNYAIDSTINGGSIINGNLENCNIGSGLSGNIEGYSNISNVTNGVSIFGGYFDLCDINGVDIESATISSSNILDSSIKKTRLIDSQVSRSYIKGCDLLENDGILVNGAEIMCDWINNIGDRSINSLGGVNGVFERISSTIKLWISESDYYRFKTLDSFFVTKLNKSFFLANLSSDEMVKLPVETEFVLDKFYNTDLSDGELLVSVKTSLENRYKTIINLDGSIFKRSSTTRDNAMYSIDIQVGAGTNSSYDNLGHYYEYGIKKTSSDVTTINNKLVKLDIDKLFTNSLLSSFNVKSGLIESSNWISGSNMSHSPSLSINNIGVIDGIISINVSNLRLLGSEYLRIGDNIWLNGIGYGGIVFDDAVVVTSIDILTDVITLIGINGVIYQDIFSVSMNDAKVVTLKIDDSKISGGFFNGTLFRSSTFNVSDYDISERMTLDNINKMRVVNSTFDSSIFGNVIESGIFHGCDFISGTTVNGGILSNSKWYGSGLNHFGGGVFDNQGVWYSGIFSDGIFKNSNWLAGTFNDGSFRDNSQWISGNFNGGNFYNAKWVGGFIADGVFGNSAYNTELTEISGITTISDITVINAVIGGDDLVWNGGTFNGGKFIGGLWKGGTFNGGNFTGGLWKGGTFNGGKFISLQQPYSWDDGTFNGGEFGNKKGYGSNASWRKGLFQGGLFQGHTWNDGIFTGGIFTGGEWATSNVYEESYDYLNDTINGHQYGIWNNGNVVDNKFEVLTNEYTYNDTNKARNNSKLGNYVEFNNVLWKSGKFSHTNGYFNKSVWFGGIFEKGFVEKSYINPYVRRSYGSNIPSFGVETMSIWKGGTFNSGKMYKTKWVDGTFNGGEMWGSIWENGIWNYGDANGILWLGGRWRNGNWDGSPYTELFDVTRFDTPRLAAGGFSGGLIDFVNVVNIERDQMLSTIYGTNFTGQFTNKIHINNFCKYDNLTRSSDVNRIGNFINFPNSWLTDGGIVATNIIGVSSKSSTDEFRLNVPYCDDERCYDDSNLFIDVFYGYEMKFTFTETTSDVYIRLNIGEMQGDANNDITQITPGEIGYDIDGKPVIRLNTSITEAVFKYFPKLTDISQSLSYRIENLGDIDLNVGIVNIEVTRIKTTYDALNNTLVDFDKESYLLPNGVFTNIAVENGNVVKFKYGNGSFTKGVWENGVWNDGYRVDETFSVCESVSDFIQITEFVYIITLSIGGDISIYSLGDKVSVSNIIGIDYNNKRTLIKGSLVIRDIQKDSGKIVLEVVSNYKLRLIKRDSDAHVIKLSQNIWLSGAFLNGVFNGIMNYGIVSGFPYITHLDKTHMIDGIFDGGKIGGDNNDSLVQNFIFYDNVVIKRNFYVPSLNLQINKPIANSQDRFYRSWAAFNYNIGNESVNLYSNDTVYISKWGGNSPVLNHSGRSTNDVITSKSRFMNLNNIEQRTYDLGLDKTVYNELIPQGGLFTYPFRVGADSPSKGEFEKNGWTYKTIGGQVVPQLSANYANTRVEDSNVLFVDIPVGGSFLLNNIGRVELFYDMTQKMDEQRYSVIEFQLRDFVGAITYDDGTSPSIFFGNAPNSYSINKEIINHTESTNVGKVRKEYFFNRKSLDMFLLASGQTSSFEIKSVKFSELAMIPFFEYFSDGGSKLQIDDSAKVPKYLPAPEIVYSDDYDFIDNITATIDILSLNIPSTVNFANNIDVPILNDPIIDETGGSVTIKWFDPINKKSINSISGYELSYGEGYPYSVVLPVTTKTQSGEYTATLSSLVVGIIYTIRIRSIANKVGKYSQYVTKKFTFKPVRTVYYIGYLSQSGGVTGEVAIPFDEYTKIYVGSDNITYSGEYTQDLSNQVNGQYRVINDENFNQLDSARVSSVATIINNKLSLGADIQPTLLVAYDMPLYAWENTNDTPQSIDPNYPNVKRLEFYACNIGVNILIGDRLFDVGEKNPISYTRWIAIKVWDFYSSMVGSLIGYRLIRVNEQGIVITVSVADKVFKVAPESQSPGGLDYEV